MVCTVYRLITVDELPSFVELPKGLAEGLDALQEILQTCSSFISVKVWHHRNRASFRGRLPQSTEAAHEIFPAGPENIHHKFFVHSLHALSAILRRGIGNLVDPGYKSLNIQRPDPDPLAAVRYSSRYSTGLTI